MSFATYEAMVDTFLRDDSTEVFGNFSPEHANYIISKFIEKAQSQVAIISGSFADAFYDGNKIYELLRNTARRLDKDGAIRIITVDGKRSKLLTELAATINKECGKSVLQYRPAIANGIKHFAVVDRKRYRLEEIHDVPNENNYPDVVKAEVCCNGAEKAEKLLSFFETAWETLSKPPVKASV